MPCSSNNRLRRISAAACVGSACWILLAAQGLGQQSLTTPLDSARSGSVQPNPYNQSSAYSVNPPSYAQPGASQAGAFLQGITPSVLNGQRYGQPMLIQPSSSPYAPMWNWIRQANESKPTLNQRGEPNRQAEDIDGSSRMHVSRAADIGLSFNRNTDDGLVISEIVSGGPIAQFSIHKGDNVLSVNGARVASEGQFLHHLLSPQMGNQYVKVNVWRNGRLVTILVEPSLLVSESSASNTSNSQRMPARSGNPDR